MILALYPGTIRVHWRPDGSLILRGVIVVLDGVALWFIAILYAAYSSGAALPWFSFTDFLISARLYTLTWVTTRAYHPPAVLMYGGFLLIGVGPLWYWLVKPVIARRKSESRLSRLERLIKKL